MFTVAVPLYGFASSGTCESNGMKSIHTKAECIAAAVQDGKSTTNFKIHQDPWEDQRPTGCSWHDGAKNLELWESSSGQCEINGYSGCFCNKLPGW